MSNHFTAKRGDSLSDLELLLRDRKKQPLDLTNATAVLFYMRSAGSASATNEVDGLPCEVKDPPTAGIVAAPSVPLGTPGLYMAYLKSVYGSKEIRIPSIGHFGVTVEENFE